MTIIFKHFIKLIIHNFNQWIGASTCQACPDGFSCANGLAQLCPLGSYCTGGTPIVCPDGKYGSKLGLISESECSPCPSGKYCTSGIISGDCDNGFYCRLGAKESNPNSSDCTDENEDAGPCPAGYFCSEVTNHIEVPCPPGMFYQLNLKKKHIKTLWKLKEWLLPGNKGTILSGFPLICHVKIVKLIIII